MVANADSATVSEDSTDNVIDVLLNDTDPDNLSPPLSLGLSVTAVGTASHGTVSLVGDEVRYTPVANYYGGESFTDLSCIWAVALILRRTVSRLVMPQEGPTISEDSTNGLGQDKLYGQQDDDILVAAF